jgi:restriction system protein
LLPIPTTSTAPGASKGILVTTSGYGSASFDFAQNKPIELIAGLLYLLTEYTGIDAKIVPPDDWKDPVADTEAVIGRLPFFRGRI